MNAEFQRTARRDKKVFLNEQCKETEENRKGKIRDTLKKIGDIKGTFHTRADPYHFCLLSCLTEVEEMKKRWQEYTEELYKKGLNDWIIMMVWSLT